MKKKMQLILIVMLLSVTLSWLPKIAQAHTESTTVTHTSQTSSELMELFLTYSIQNPYFEVTKNRVEFMFETEEKAIITITTNNYTKKITDPTKYHQFVIANLEPGNNLITITAKTADQNTHSKTITINLPEKPEKDSKKIHHKSNNENFTHRKKGNLL
ncbi:hypothetical protein HCJ52_07760 [Listeria sp. FSL L7-1485]|uniref:Uncharacterized protein n=1 Tax=Listeria immobilis TaxID=2713502 RepID=A0A7X0X7C8_9LIST|nr:hypothetical protein [Listeria immobilis]MBC1488842.1 hypothetical protein [Listeria immobilis]MBC1536021.1 hypothetical protein [Listeria immobilis]